MSKLGAKTKIILGVAALAALIALSWLAYGALSRAYQDKEPPGQTTPAPGSGAGKTDLPEETGDGDLAVDFTVLDKDGKEVRLSDFAGRPVVLNFWASWCGPCRSEMPHFEELYRELGGEVEFMMVNITVGNETKSAADRFVASGGYTFPVYYDTTADAAMLYTSGSIPVSVFIDGEGYVRENHLGTMTENALRAAIEKIR